MRRLNVRCCCEPAKIFGTLDLPEAAVDRRRCSVIVQELVPKPAFIETLDDIRNLMTVASATQHEIRVKPFHERRGDDWTDELAVYSDDRPIEFWRKLPGFIEGDRV